MPYISEARTLEKFRGLAYNIPLEELQNLRPFRIISDFIWTAHIKQEVLACNAHNGFQETLCLLDPMMSNDVV